MINDVKHICVCVCTYKRPLFLKRLLDELGVQETGEAFNYSIVVVDNDRLGSAKDVISDFKATSSIPITYCVEPRQGIALARNKAIQNATGDFVACIDDDEFPCKHWLRTLFRVCNEYGADGVLGAVKRHFDGVPPRWVVRGNFYDRPIRPTGLRVEWREGRTGNVLLKRELFTDTDQPFRPEFRSGEDVEFFRRMITNGHLFIWSSEALVFEVVPPVRWKRSVMLRRALLRGAMNRIQPTFGALSVVKSVIAIPCYAAALPLTLLLGHHRVMSLLIRLCDHLGKLLAVVGINPIREPYVTE